MGGKLRRKPRGVFEVEFGCTLLSSKRGAGGTQGLLQNTGSELSESGGRGGSREGKQRPTSSLGYLKPQVKTGDHNLPRHGC